jgi:hypothetical protein
VGNLLHIGTAVEVVALLGGLHVDELEVDFVLLGNIDRSFSDVAACFEECALSLQKLIYFCAHSGESLLCLLGELFHLFNRPVVLLDGRWWRFVAELWREEVLFSLVALHGLDSWFTLLHRSDSEHGALSRFDDGQLRFSLFGG